MSFKSTISSVVGRDVSAAEHLASAAYVNRTGYLHSNFEAAGRSWRRRSRKMGMRMRLMVFFYRMGQSQRLLGTFLWSVTLTLLAFQYVQPFLVGIGLMREDQVLLGLTVLWTVTTVALMTLGILFDRVFKLWMEDAAIGVSRNPYSVSSMYPKELVAFRDLWVPFFRAYAEANPSPEIRRALEKLEQWVAQGSIE